MKINIKEFTTYLYNFAAVCFFEAMFLENTISLFAEEYKHVTQILKGIGVVFAILSGGLVILYKGKLYSTNRIRIVELLLVGILITGFLANDYVLLSILIFSYFGKYIKSENVLKNLFRSLALTILIILFFCMIGMLPNKQDLRIGDNALRYTLGFSHCSKLPLALLFLLLYYFLIKQEISRINLFVSIILTFLAYYLCGSRNALINSTMLIFLLAGLKYTHNLRLKSLLKQVYKYSFVISLILTFVGVYLYRSSSSIGRVLNILLNNRLATPANYLEVRSLRLFNIMSYSEYENLLQYGRIQVDNSYFYIAIRYGIVALCIFIILCTNIMKNSIKNNNIFEATVLAILAFSIMIDGLVFSYGLFGIYLYFANKLNINHKRYLTTTVEKQNYARKIKLDIS